MVYQNFFYEIDPWGLFVTHGKRIDDVSKLVRFIIMISHLYWLEQTLAYHGIRKLQIRNVL